MNALALTAVVLMSNAPEPAPSVDELRGVFVVAERWTLADGPSYRLQPPPPGPLPEAAYRREELDPKASPDLLVGLKWKQKQRTDSLLELELDDGFAGGRLLAWHVPGGLMVERLGYGSGVHVAWGQRLKLAPSDHRH